MITRLLRRIHDALGRRRNLRCDDWLMGVPHRAHNWTNRGTKARCDGYTPTAAEQAAGQWVARDAFGIVIARAPSSRAIVAEMSRLGAPALRATAKWEATDA